MKIQDIKHSLKEDLIAFYEENKKDFDAAGVTIDGEKKEHYEAAVRQYLEILEGGQKSGQADLSEVEQQALDSREQGQEDALAKAESEGAPEEPKGDVKEEVNVKTSQDEEDSLSELLTKLDEKGFESKSDLVGHLERINDKEGKLADRIASIDAKERSLVEREIMITKRENAFQGNADKLMAEKVSINLERDALVAKKKKLEELLQSL